MSVKSKIIIKSFVSYAHSDDEYFDPFMKGLVEMLAPSKKYDFEVWWDNAILPGETWSDEINNALEECALGILLLSPAFLSSDYITKNELPKLIGMREKVVIPIILRKVNLKLHDLKGLEERQIFRLKAGPNNYRSYAQCGTSQKNDFVYELHEQIERRLDKVYA